MHRSHAAAAHSRITGLHDQRSRAKPDEQDFKRLSKFLNDAKTLAMTIQYLVNHRTPSRLGDAIENALPLGFCVTEQTKLAESGQCTTTYLHVDFSD
jgi:hypothetical protein